MDSLVLVFFRISREKNVHILKSIVQYPVVLSRYSLVLGKYTHMPKQTGCMEH